ncbi:MAG: cytochrome c biogenesis protein CcsA [Proteobacteria bacterium]|uniref:heme ABC transporter permease CcmC n=1 Tax=Aquabacterium sp. TaxID=1872578 RepID=UPI0035C672AB|nr:cytochrome c biogenesis protein CcsA [Pseudomonadota bacterium]
MTLASLLPPSPQPPLAGRDARRQRWQQALLRHASPRQAHALAGRILPWAWGIAALATLAGLYVGFFVAPTDHQQGEAYRIIFVHVPAAWLSMVLYVAMAFWGAVGWVFNTRASSMLARALAPTGALFCFLALWTGALWGKPTWGTWWVWDARLTSELILLFLYLGVMALQSAIDDPRRGDHAGTLLAVVGVVNVPVIYFSVKWWNTLHQGASISLKAAPTLASSMLTGLLLCTVGLWAWALAVVLQRLRLIVLQREQHADWVLQAQREERA